MSEGEEHENIVSVRGMLEFFQFYFLISFNSRLYTIYVLHFQNVFLPDNLLTSAWVYVTYSTTYNFCSFLTYRNFSDLKFQDSTKNTFPSHLSMVLNNITYYQKEQFLTFLKYLGLNYQRYKTANSSSYLNDLIKFKTKGFMKQSPCS